MFLSAGQRLGLLVRTQGRGHEMGACLLVGTNIGTAAEEGNLGHLFIAVGVSEQERASHGALRVARCLAGLARGHGALGGEAVARGEMHLNWAGLADGWKSPWAPPDGEHLEVQLGHRRIPVTLRE